MAELVIGNAGAVLGQHLLPQGLSLFGARIAGQAIGRTVGSLAGAYLDGRYLAPPAEGPRIREFHLTESREGASLPVAYGRMRVGAQVIWAAEFKERREVGGGKGGPRVADYSYTLSFAAALCEGEVARVSRCWANGEPFDLSKANWRFYRGTEDQIPDPLIEAIEGEAPAYRGVAYVVFEDMPVDQFGARLPQLSFEVVRPAAGGAGRLESVARAVNMIPGSGEFALSTAIVRRRIGPGRETAENLHGAEVKSDFEASLDQLEAELPNVTRVNLVVAWFGSDLRCGECLIRPGVEIADKTTRPYGWSVAGQTRGGAYVVSATNGRPNYGGTPADESVRQAIAALKARGYNVTLYPFLLMDIPPGNGLPDPYGGPEQAAFPWRGRITASAGDAGPQVEAFFGRYRPFVLHYAGLAAETGADGFLIGSELAGLTRLAVGGAYPAVEALRQLAADVRAVFGGGVEISYAADWTEYGARIDGGDASFPLDALWADAAIDYVGLDWYPPMADWRDGSAHADAVWGDGRSLAYLAANVAGGEAFDWHYVDAAGRAAQTRLPIADGAYGEPWVFRPKDIAGWWSATHHPRIGGARSATATGWVAGMKPVRFVELGVPAVDKGANQPNVFYDPKSSESALPHFSNGSRDDLIQRRAIEAVHAHWSQAENNPDSGVYVGRMIPADGIALWTWDARPYPAFPARSDAWGDANNWGLGHWLNGRVGLALLPDVVADVCAKAGVDADVSALASVVTGYRFDGPCSARSVLEPLAAAYGIDATEREGKIFFRMRGADAAAVDGGRLVEGDAPALSMVRAGLEAEAPRVRLRFIDAEAEHEPGVAISGGASTAVVDAEAALALDRAQAQRVAEAMAEQLELQRERAQFALAADGLRLEAGDVAVLDGASWRIVETSDAGVIRFEAVRAGARASPVLVAAAPIAPPVPAAPNEPDVVIVDAPPLPGYEDDGRPIGFAFAEPWTAQVILSAGPDPTELSVRGRIARPCAIGRLESALHPFASGRWQETSVWVSLPEAGLSSRSELSVLNGANAALVETAAGWELIQFAEAELVDVETWKLTRLLRGQQGSEPANAVGASIGARVLFLTGAEQRLEVADWERGLELDWRAWRSLPEEPEAWSDRQAYRALGQRMWSPAHLRAERSGGDLVVSWIRRARKGGDSWSAGEPPHEAAERYRVRASGSGGVVRQWDVADSLCVYFASDLAADFPAGGEVLIEAAQLGPDGEPGAWAALSTEISA